MLPDETARATIRLPGFIRLPARTPADGGNLCGRAEAIETKVGPPYFLAGEYDFFCTLGIWADGCGNRGEEFTIMAPPG